MGRQKASKYWLNRADKNPLRRLDLRRASAQQVQDTFAHIGQYMTLSEAQDWLTNRRKRL